MRKAVLIQLQKNKLFFSLYILFAITACTANQAIDYRNNFTDIQKKQFEQALQETRQRLPKKIRDELPGDISYVLADLDPLPAVPCAVGAGSGRAHFGSFNRITHRFTIDYRLAIKLLEHDQTAIACAHPTWQQFAEATLLHEWIHAWDSQQNLSDDPAFLKLTYWQHGMLGAHQMNINAQRSPDAYEYRNPRESLAVNMEYYLLDKNYACRRPTLYKFFASTFGDTTEPDYSHQCGTEIMAHYAELALLKNIDPRRVYRIDYLLAAAGEDVVSSFGHSMFRIVLCAPAHYSAAIEMQVDATPFGENCLKDEAFHLVVSFRANLDDLVLDYWKGLVGGYASRPFILPYLQVKEEYTGDELRNITLYPMQLTTDERAAFINETLTQFWEYSGDYRFLTRNCAVESLNLVQASLPQHALNKYKILSPVGLRDAFYDSGLVIPDDPDIIHIKSRREELQKMFFIAFPESDQADIDSALMYYLQSTQAVQRRVLFPSETVARVAALLQLERQIKRMNTRELGLLARQALYQEALDNKIREKIQDLMSPLQSDNLQIGGYGVPYSNEIHYSKSAQQQKILEIKQSVIQWLQVHKPTLWQEYDNVDENIRRLDILALKNQPLSKP
jgi:hypothetical protein